MNPADLYRETRRMLEANRARRDGAPQKPPRRRFAFDQEPATEAAAALVVSGAYGSDGARLEAAAGRREADNGTWTTRLGHFDRRLLSVVNGTANADAGGTYCELFNAVPVATAPDNLVAWTPAGSAIQTVTLSADQLNDEGALLLWLGTFNASQEFSGWVVSLDQLTAEAAVDEWIGGSPFKRALWSPTAVYPFTLYATFTATSVSASTDQDGLLGTVAGTVTPGRIGFGCLGSNCQVSYLTVQGATP